MEDEKDLVIENLLDITKSISTMDYRCPIKKPYCNLARKLKFLTPLFEELKEMKDLIPDETFRALVSYKEALCCAKELLRFGNQGNRLYLVLEREQIMLKFQKVTTQLERTLSRIPYDKLDISDEVKEQVDLVLAQFRRAEERTETLDVELYEDLLSVYDESCDPNKERAVLRKLTEKLQLMGTADLKQESLALYNMVVASDGVSGESIEKISMLQKKIKDFVLTENFGMGSHATATSLSKSGRWQYSIDTNSQPVVVPDDLRCPISLELMIDPVIVSTGQTYERACIKKWINTGHDTCPKTQQSLSSTVLTPNYALRSLIAQWCEVNGIEPPEQPVNPHPSKYSACTAAERANIDTLLRKLTSSNLEDPRSAAGELRLLAKRNTENRVCIAEAGAIPLLIGLLSAKDHRMQEHAVTTLLNLSICEDNKTRIIISGAIPGIVYVLRKGSMEARENAAATIFSLSVVDQYKVIIGTSGAIPALITLLSEGRHRGKKDAATALFNLCIYQGNKARSVRAGIVPTLIRLLTQTEGGMVDEVLSILYILASHPDGKTAIRATEAVPILVDVIGSGTPRNRENAAAVLVHLSVGDEQHLAEAKELGLMQLLLDMVQNGTDRGKRKAIQLLEQLNRFVEQQKHAQPQSEVLTPVSVPCSQLQL